MGISSSLLSFRVRFLEIRSISSSVRMPLIAGPVSNSSIAIAKKRMWHKTLPINT